MTVFRDRKQMPKDSYVVQIEKNIIHAVRKPAYTPYPLKRYGSNL